jgi:hypothetical protein
MMGSAGFQPVTCRLEACATGVEFKENFMDFLKDLWGFLKVRKKYWLLPIILTLLFFGALMIFAGGSAIAPFIYTIF